MPRAIHCPQTEPLELAELVQVLNDERFDPADEESFAGMGPWLKRLCNNRRFLADVAVAELKDRCGTQERENRYSSQVIMLHRASEKYFIRANFWPSPKDSVFKASGTSPFFYHVPHDHNFSFLTVGYLGPGYWSEYYEADYESIVGLPGEKVDLKFIEKARLEPGKVMLYRAHRDVHNQLPADAMSVSINIMEASPKLPYLAQYRFDPAKCEIAGVLTKSSSEALLALAATHAGGNARDLVESFARHHPCERLQFAAIRELAAAESEIDEGLAILARGRASGNRWIAGMSALETARVEAARSWIERG